MNYLKNIKFAKVLRALSVTGDKGRKRRLLLIPNEVVLILGRINTLGQLELLLYSSKLKQKVHLSFSLFTWMELEEVGPKTTSDVYTERLKVLSDYRLRYK